MKKPTQRRRDRVLTEDERREILAAIKDRAFREFSFAMMETGARPGEVRRVGADVSECLLAAAHRWCIEPVETGVCLRES